MCFTSHWSFDGSSVIHWWFWTSMTLTCATKEVHCVCVNISVCMLCKCGIVFFTLTPRGYSFCYFIFYSDTHTYTYCVIMKMFCFSNKSFSCRWIDLCCISFVRHFNMALFTSSKWKLLLLVFLRGCSHIIQWMSIRTRKICRNARKFGEGFRKVTQKRQQTKYTIIIKETISQCNVLHIVLVKDFRSPFQEKHLIIIPVQNNS